MNGRVLEGSGIKVTERRFYIAGMSALGRSLLHTSSAVEVLTVGTIQIARAIAALRLG
jgi:hypothetical protein